MNELPDFLFPEGKQLRHRRKRVQSTESEAKKPKLKYLDSYCLDLTDRAAAGKLDRVIGRDSELMRVMQILCRRQKNNPFILNDDDSWKPLAKRPFPSHNSTESFIFICSVCIYSWEESRGATVGETNNALVYS